MPIVLKKKAKPYNFVAGRIISACSGTWKFHEVLFNALTNQTCFISGVRLVTVHP
jgi:hypothetical protein